MYNVIFESDNGQKYVFGADGETVFDMDLGNGVSVDVGTSQGFSQVGETVESMTVGGRTITVRGTVFGNVQSRKKIMRKVFAPFVWGKLIFEGKHYIRVCVKDTPTFSPVKDDGRFTMLLYAPFPFFYSVDDAHYNIGEITPMFSFPVNYATPHKFGERGTEKYTNVYNNGDIAVPFNVYMETFGTSANPMIVNLDTQEYLKLNGTLNTGDVANIYRDSNNILRAELSTGGESVDILSWVDDGSTLFQLNPGDNIIAFDDDGGGSSLTVKFTFSPAVVAVYED